MSLTELLKQFVLSFPFLIRALLVSHTLTMHLLDQFQADHGSPTNRLPDIPDNYINVQITCQIEKYGKKYTSAPANGTHIVAFCI